MKKSLLLTFAILLSMTMMAQNRAILINETFDNAGAIPGGWAIQGDGFDNWSVSPTNHAGGSVCEMHLTWDPEFTGTTRLVSPGVDLTGVSDVTMTFKHYLDYYMDTTTLGIATSSDYGNTWNTAWQQDYTETGQYTISQNIATSDMGHNYVMFCIFFTGNSYNYNDWYFDDIKVFSLEDLDCGVASFDMDNIILTGDIPVSFDAGNFGRNTITSIEASYQFDGFDMVTETFDVNIESGASQIVTFETPQTLVPGTYPLTINITSVNGEEDDNASNNSLTKPISISFGTTQKKPMIEHFSSSTCLPCVDTDNYMSTITANNPGKYTYTKFPCNFPGTGDPYFTNEVATRRNYYGINAIPDIMWDGTISCTPYHSSSFTQTQITLDQQYNTPSFADIRGAFNVDGNNITITADFMAYADMAGVTAFVTVNEKMTTGNVGTNGATEFHHIMMKMLPGTEGTTIDIIAGEYTRLEFTHDMSTTFVEEMDDLEVAVWLQNYDTKEIYNSTFLYEYTEHPYPVQNLQLVTNTDNTMTASFEAPESGTPTGYNIYINSELVAENTTDLEYTFPSESGNFYTAEVIALYEDDKTSVKVAVGTINNMSVEDNMVENHCSIYPNPANNYVTVVNNTDIRTISIYNCIGTLVDRIEVTGNSVELSTSKYDTGIYFMNIMNVNGHSSSKKLVITH